MICSSCGHVCILGGSYCDLTTVHLDAKDQGSSTNHPPKGDLNR